MAETTPAEQSLTTLDFTAPESLSMRVTQGQSDLTIDPCVITNTGSDTLKLSSVEITAATGWTVVESSTDFTTADSKNQIAFTTESHDFANGAYAPGQKIAAGSNTTLQLAGKISEQADLTNATQVASMVLTVEKVNIISFTIADCDTESIIVGTYQAEEGMTWEDFIISSYNNGDFLLDNGYVQYKNTSNAPSSYDGIALLSDVIRDGGEYLYGNSPSGNGKDQVIDPGK